MASTVRYAVRGLAWEPALDAPGRMREALLDDRARRRGAHYTPAGVVDALVALVLDRAGADAHRTATALRVCDPACGGGVFLLAMADALAERGLEPAAIVTGCLWGCDLDPLAVAVTEASLGLWALEHGVVAGPGEDLFVGDGLATEPGSWPRAPEAGFDVVVGNPPFQAQLARATARSAHEAPLAADLAGLRGPYTDTAALFLAHAVRLTRPGGIASLIQPLSVLSARDTAAVRRWLADETEVQGLWLPEEQVFAASVQVCAPVLRRRLRPAPPSTPPVTGTDGELVWSRLAAAQLGVPRVELGGHGTVADLATATAGFRDQFYGLAPHVVEAPAETVGAGDPRARLSLITAGLIDPLHNRWGTTETRFAGRRFERPCLPVASLVELPAALASWVEARRAPKLLMATQTRIVEVLVDADGALLPSVPVIALHAEASSLWRLAAAVSAPPVTAWALARTVGAARSAGALKLAARQVLQLPLPSDPRAWRHAAELLREASTAAAAGGGERWAEVLRRYGEVATEAYGLPREHPVLAWWAARLPPWR